MNDKVNIYPILKGVSECFNISISELKGNSRKRAVVTPRCVAIYEIRNKTDWTLQRIGKLFKKDHTTVIYSLNLYEELEKFDKEFQWSVQEYRAKLNQSA